MKRLKIRDADNSKKGGGGVKRSKSRRRESVIRISSYPTVPRGAARAHYGNLPFLSNASMKMYNHIWLDRRYLEYVTQPCQPSRDNYR